jgi:hypothetical protein
VLTGGAAVTAGGVVGGSVAGGAVGAGATVAGVAFAAVAVGTVVAGIVAAMVAGGCAAWVVVVSSDSAGAVADGAVSAVAAVCNVNAVRSDEPHAANTTSAAAAKPKRADFFNERGLYGGLMV